MLASGSLLHQVKRRCAQLEAIRSQLATDEGDERISRSLGITRHELGLVAVDLTAHQLTDEDRETFIDTCDAEHVSLCHVRDHDGLVRVDHAEADDEVTGRSRQVDVTHRASHDGITEADRVLAHARQNGRLGCTLACLCNCHRLLPSLLGQLLLAHGAPACVQHHLFRGCRLGE